MSSDVHNDQLGVKFHNIPETKLERFSSLFAGNRHGLVRSQPGNFVATPMYGDNAEKIYRLEPRTDDIWLVTFPKCGTTWMSELLWLITNDFDTKKAKRILLSSRVSFLEIPYLRPEEISPHAKTTVSDLEAMANPRIIKTHLPFYLLHPKLLDQSKVVYMARNPKDVIVSFYFHHKLIRVHDYQGTLEEFVQYFTSNQIIYTPFFPHILDAWSKRHHPNLHFVFYEDMKSDLRGEIEKVCAFLNKSPTDEQLTEMTEHLRFDNFEKNESVNMEKMRNTRFMNAEGKFIRKGKTGDWKNHFNPEVNEQLDKWIADNLAGSDLKFVSELEHQD